jgi:uncharacterized membrane-anchored protein
MRRIVRIFMAALLTATLLPSVAVAASQSATDAEIAKMHWSGGPHSLANSHGKFAVPPAAEMVQDADAARADDLINGTSGSATEGLVRIPKQHALLYMEYVDAGYVTLDDWKDLDATKMLDDMRQSTEDGNEDRRKNNVSGIHIDSWIQPPTLDRTHNTVRYIVRLHDDDRQQFLNAVALALGRRGYERFTLVSNANKPDASRDLLSSMIGDYTFTKGFRFSDYVTGDKLAGIGVAALVGSVAGVAIAKTVGFGAILLFAKKFIVLIVAAIAGGFGWLRKKFSNRSPGEKWQA